MKPRNKRCHYCKEVVNKPPSHTNKKHIFCNKSCYLTAIRNNRELTSNYRKVNMNFNCENCERPFTRRPHGKNIPKYCSINCAAKHRGKDQSGANHWNWKGGDTRYLRKVFERPRPEICDICGQKGKKRNGIVLDHDHKTNRIRGWLCSNCNTIIGLAHEDTKVLGSIIDYINENSL